MSLHVLEFLRFSDGVWNLPPQELDALRARFPSVRFSSPRDASEADALMPEIDAVLGWAVNARNLGAASRLKWIHVPAAGVGSLLFPELIDSPVVVTNGRGLHAESMAEHTLGVVLSFARKLHLARDAQRDRRWAQNDLWRDPPPFGRLTGTTMLLVGLGAIGSAIASRARALGVRVVAVRRTPQGDPAPADEQRGVEELPGLLGRADWVVLAAPLTPATRHLLGADELARMRRDAVLVNLGRGALVDEAALVEALRAGRIAGAALDVVEHEPLDAKSPLWEMPQVLLTPHISGLGPAYWERAMSMFADNLTRYLEGRPLFNVVDKRAGY